MEYYFANDDQQSGPHKLEELAALGVRAETLVWYAGLPEWKPAGTLPQIAPVLFASPQPPAVSALPYQIPTTAPAQNGMAIASLVLGIVSLVTFLCYFFGLIPGILAIIFGVLARKQIGAKDQPGYGMATAGLVCGSIAVSLVVLGLMVIAMTIANHR